MKIDTENCQIEITISLPGSEDTYASCTTITTEEFFNNRNIPIFDIVSKGIDATKYRLINNIKQQKQD